MLKVGITGGIGSGKTTVARVFQTLGIPVYYADEAAKRLMNENAALKQQLVAIFSAKAYGVGGQLNRSWIAEQVFNDDKKLDALNALIHPATIADAERWMSKQQHAYAIKEAALMFETEAASNLNFIIGVSAPTNLRLQRAIDRDNSPKKAIEARMEKQLSPSIALKLCDAVIVNDNQQAILPQIMNIHHQLLEMAKA
jgi:dephospho-CoA kinase